MAEEVYAGSIQQPKTSKTSHFGTIIADWLTESRGFVYAVGARMATSLFTTRRFICGNVKVGWRNMKVNGEIPEFRCSAVEQFFYARHLKNCSTVKMSSETPDELYRVPRMSKAFQIILETPKMDK